MNFFKNKGQCLYIFEATLENLIALLCTASFLATLTSSLGMPDSLTGIVSSFISMGCFFQLVSILFQVKKHKSFVVILSIINQLLFTLLYVIPLFGIFGISQNAKITLLLLQYSAHTLFTISPTPKR